MAFDARPRTVLGSKSSEIFPDSAKSSPKLLQFGAFRLSNLGFGAALGPEFEPGDCRSGTHL